MENNTSGHAVTEQYHAPDELERTERQANQSQRLADVTAAFRTARANEAEEVESEAEPELNAYERYRQSLTDDDYDDNDEAEDLILSADEPAPVSQSHRTQSPSTEEHVADDVDDLNDYMQSFLQRMKCNPTSSPNETPKPATQTAAPTTPPKELPQYKGPKAAPECKSALAQMRELANTTARDSISKHAAEVGSRSGRLLATSAICCVLSIVLAILSSSTLSYTFIASVVVFGVAAATCWSFLSGLNKLAPVTKQGTKPA